MRYLIGRYHEIVLKGGNRWRFVEQLRQNLKTVFADCGIGAIRGEGPRMIVELPDELDEAIVRERAALMFGLQNFSISHPVPLTIEAIKRGAIEAARGQSARSFRIRTKRSDKRFALTSLEIDQQAGAAVQGSHRARGRSRKPRSDHLDRSDAGRGLHFGAKISRRGRPAGLGWAGAESRCCRAESTRRWPPGG